MEDDAAARDRIAERGFIGLLVPIWLRRWFRRSLPVGAPQVALYVARRIVLGVIALDVGDRFFRGWARTAKEADELKERMRSELGREPTDEEFYRAFARQRGYDWADGI